MSKSRQTGIIMSKSFNYYLRALIPPYCAAAKEIDPTVCGYLRFMNYNIYPNYFNRGTGSIKCRACPHCVGRYAVYPKIIHSFMWSVLCSPEGYSVHFARIKDRINNIDDCLTFTRYMTYLISLTENTCHDHDDIADIPELTYSFNTVRLYIGRWHAGRI